MAKLLFITGTDTGVGKTVLTALLLRDLRDRGCHALAVKPFASGSRADARLLRQAGDNVLTLDEVNPFFFEQPVAPAAAGRKKEISIDSVLEKIRALEKRCEVLLIEGSGGLLVPLGRHYTVADLIVRLGCPTIVVSRNRLGTLNHTALTLRHLEAIGIEHITVVVMGLKTPDISARTNPILVKKMAKNCPVISVPFLGPGPASPPSLKKNVRFLKKTLAQIWKGDNLSTFFPSKGRKGWINKTR